MSPRWFFFFDEAEGKYRRWFSDWGKPPVRLPFPPTPLAEDEESQDR